MTESLFDNQRGGERACGNQVDDGGTAWVIRGSQRPGPGPGVGAAGAARAARAAAAGRAGARVGGGRGGVRLALPGARVGRVGGRGVVRDRGDPRGRGAGGRGPRPGRRKDPAGPRSWPVLAGGGRGGAGVPATAPPPPRIMVVTCPDLHSTGLSAGPDPQTANRHERVIAAVTGFCPDVEVVEPGVCAFGARGPARYFGGEAALAARISAALADLGEQSRAGVADGLFAALLAARDGQNVPPGGTARFLAAQPVSVLADQDLAALLSRLGLGTLGDFAALPVRDVASRFGDVGEGAHRLARGLDSRPLATRPPPADLSVAQEFDPPEPR